MEVIGQGMALVRGPSWVRDGEFLLFSDIPNNALMLRGGTRKWLKLFLKPAGYTGGDPRGGESGSNGSDP